MSVTKPPKQLIQDISAATIEIFSSNHDDYPAIEIQPFEGSYNKRKNRAKFQDC